MTTPAKLKFIIIQGATFRKRLAWLNPDRSPIDLTGCTARMQVRADVGSPVVLLALTTEDGGITLGGSTGSVALYASDVTTAALNWEEGVFDIEIAHANGDVTRLAQGGISVSPEVTR